MEKFYFSEKKYVDFTLAVLWRDFPLPGVMRTYITYTKGGLKLEIPHFAIHKSSELSSKVLNFLESCVKGIVSDIDHSLFDLSGLTGFQKTVLETLRDKVPAGKVISYSKLAELSHCPKGARPVGSVMRENPFPLYFPCHRVVKADASLGEYQPGPKVKKYLLEKEGVYVSNSGIISSEFIIK